MQEKKSFFNATFFITSALCFVPCVLGFVFYDKLPEKIPQSYSWNGQVNWSLPKPWGFILCPLIILIINSVFQIIIWRLKNPLNKKVRTLLHWVIPLTSIPLNCFIILKPVGLKTSALQVGILTISVLFIVLGNYLPKTEENFFVGVRAPWINKNPNVWFKTNRLAGILFVIMGFVNLPAAFFRAGKYIFITSFCAVNLVLLIYSLIIAKLASEKSQDEEAPEQTIS